MIVVSKINFNTGDFLKIDGNISDVDKDFNLNWGCIVTVDKGEEGVYFLKNGKWEKKGVKGSWKYVGILKNRKPYNGIIYNSAGKIVFRIRPSAVQLKKKPSSFTQENYIYYVKSAYSKTKIS